MTVTLEQKFQPTEDTLANDVDGETILLNLESGSYFGLNRTGSRIWQLMQQRLSLQQIVEIVESEFEVNREELSSDVLRLAADLETRHLVKCIAGSDRESWSDR